MLKRKKQKPTNQKKNISITLIKMLNYYQNIYEKYQNVEQKETNNKQLQSNKLKKKKDGFLKLGK